MRRPWFILMALAIAGAALAQGDKAGDPKAPAAKAAPKKIAEPRGPRLGPGQAGSPAAAKSAPAETQKPAK